MNLDRLLKRFPKDYLEKRLSLQVDHSAYRLGSKKFLSIYIENIEWIFVVLKWLLKLSGLYSLGQRNTIHYRITQNHLKFDNLPKSFEGYRILHLSDIHIDGILDKGKNLYSILDDLEYDLCVITGDYRYHTHGEYDLVIEGMKELRSHLNKDTFCILGNHDFIEFVEPFEEFGFKCLINERIKINKNNDSIYFLGSDDMHFYESQNFSKLFEGLESNDFKVMLLHSPEGYKQAESDNVSLYLCGHTHGGQICLPGELPIISNSSAPKKFNKSAWTYGKMQGYTSNGVGSSGLDVRFFCPPEIIIHHLHGNFY
ncbi:MAG: metallophosphoesterase [Leptospira sp.]|nr:MAG: metallophosphoesterase [Leptospira sp.]